MTFTPPPSPVALLDSYFLQEAKVLDCLKTALHKLWESSRYTIPVNQGQLVQGRLTEGARAFTLQDTAVAKSPPAPAAPAAGASRVGVVSPGPLEDLVAGEAASVGQDEILPASGRRSETLASKKPADGQATEAPGESCSGGSEVRGAGVDIVAGANVSGDGKRRPRDARAATTPTRSLDAAKADGDRPQPTSHRVEESDGASQDSASNSATTGSSVDANEYAHERKGRGGAPMGAERTLSQTGGIADASASGTGRSSNSRARTGGVPCAPLAYDMQSILGGCRRASRLKRKRDARNASADSFSAKLSGCGAKDQDSKAAARAFSRVLHKVSQIA